MHRIDDPEAGVPAEAEVAAAPAPIHATPRRAEPGRHGVLIVDKPSGVTSHDVIDVVRRRLRERGAGHVGTLDPLATGLLAVAVGAATRCVPVWQRGLKTYVGTLRLGIETDTQDITGTIVAERPVGATEAMLRTLSAARLGEGMQVPPMVSAVRVGGERLYRLARRGVVVERQPRRIAVHAWEWLAFELPRATFRVRCSSGTYVRTLVHDLGTDCGCGAVLQSLRRLESQPFDLSRAVSVRELYELPASEIWNRAGIPLDEALSHAPALSLDASEVRALGYGAPLPLGSGRGADLPRDAGPRSVVFRDAEARVLALGDVHDDGATLVARPHVVFPWTVREGRACPT